ncbi:MAG: DUF4258 domain-containing protein [Betaproteobacteria bacterium]|nr:MAG: DUF4258 domain-containing protein [Betaproteobacteria bacterium]TAN55162.1 MAG: DUF4258 domain-containing protein [Betaproteobacteria bacterium]
MKITYRVHAVRRMFERGIAESDVRQTLATGVAIAEYPSDTPYPSRLVLGWRGREPLHVVTAYNAQDDEHIVVTVYEPDPKLWDDGFTRRRR